MNKIFLHLWILTLGSLLLHSCTQNESVPEVESQENKVLFKTGESESRSFIDGNLSTVGTKIRMYGYHDDAFLAANKEGKALDGKPLACVAENFWSIVDDDNSLIHYFWEGEGTYRFFGWLTDDAASQKSIPFTPVFDNRKLTVSEKIDKDYSQFDFLYSDVDERTLTTANMNTELGRSAVSVNMRHLFSAFAIGIRNTSEDDIVIKSVKLNCLHENGSAVIDYNQTPCSIEYGNTSQTTKPFVSFAGQHTLTSKTGYLPNVFNPEAGDRQYYMVWPQKGEVLNATSLTFANEDAEAAEPDASFPLVLEYTIGEVEYKKRVRLPKENWEPGKKYYLEVQVADKLVQITTTVTDWDYTDSKVDFSEHSISVKENGHLQWDATTCTIDHTKKEVYVTNGAPVEGTFAIDAPQGGQWRVSLEGDVTAFYIVDDAVPTDDGFGPIDGKVHRIKIVPTIATPDRDYKVTLKFVAITASHKTYPADDMVQDSDNDGKADIYTVVLRSVK